MQIEIIIDDTKNNKIIEDDIIEDDIIENDIIEDDIIEDDFIEDDIIENDIIEDDIIEDDIIEDDIIKDETYTTGVIYKLTNIKNNKIYIGKAKSFIFYKNGKKCRHGANGRFRDHWNSSHSDGPKRNDCPLLYTDMRDSLKSDWKIEILKICDISQLSRYETHFTDANKSSDPIFGYNIFIGNNKPNEGINSINYTEAKIYSNRKRAMNGKLKRNDLGLPANIYYRKSNLKQRNGTICFMEGYFVQIKIGTKLCNKAFMDSNFSMEERLELAKNWLSNLKKINNI